MESRSIDPVIDRPNAIRGREALVAHEARDVLRDGDATFRDATDGASRAAVRLAQVEVGRGMYGRNCRHPRDQCRGLPVDVGVHKVCVHDVGTERADVGDQGWEQDGIDVGARLVHDDVDPGSSQVLDEKITATGLEHAHSDVDTSLGERGQETEEVPFGSSDAFDFLDVQDALAISWHTCPFTRTLRVNPDAPRDRAGFGC